MFTGLIQTTGAIHAVEAAETGARLSIDAPWSAGASPALAGGESIAVNGCCLTLVRFEPRGDSVRLVFDVIHETLRVTTLGRVRGGDRVHLERSATPTTLLGGHLVQGHVDAIGIVAAVLAVEGEWRVRIEAPIDALRLVTLRGSIAVDGVSLTVAAIDDDGRTFDVCLIPETLSRTALGELEAGDEVNLETDCIAKMVERVVSLRAKG
ncbi:MAG: riboflavin synthase [Phycisphaerales bacterium]